MHERNCATPPAERLRTMMEWTTRMMEIAFAGFRARHPDLDETEAMARWTYERFHGEVSEALLLKACDAIRQRGPSASIDNRQSASGNRQSPS